MHPKYLVPALLMLSPTAFGEGQEQCIAPLPKFQQDPSLNEQQIKVTATKAEIVDDTVAVFEGKVDISSSTASIKADKARIDKNAQQLEATGDVSFRDEQLLVNSADVKLNTGSGQLSMQETDYRLTLFDGRGEAKSIELDTQKGIELKEVSFTTCPEGNNDWKIVADEITLEADEVWGEARNTRFYIQDVPVFYLPYFTFPVNPVRQTGWLFPEIDSSSSTGVSYQQPFYWNLAPNYDLTLTPRLMSDRGLQYKSEFRYMTEQHAGQLNLEYLPNDRGLDTNDDRYFYRYAHSGRVSQNWQVSADINGLSDDNYIVDLGSDFYSRADTHLYQTVGLTYFSEQLDFSFNVRDFEVIGDHPSTYKAIPELKLTYLTDTFAGLEFQLDSELAYFDNTLEGQPSAIRWHLAPGVALPYRTLWGEFLAEVRLLNTLYRQENIENTQLEENVNRTLGQGRLYGALNFERNSHWFGQSVTQTLEPKIQYLYTSFEDQSNIGRYDTTVLLNDFEGLFRGQEFTGLDRISDHNQITLGVTSRILDQNNREQFKISFGQIFYLQNNRVLAASKEDDRSALAAEIDWRFADRWFAHSDVQVSTSTEKVERSSLALEYQASAAKLIQLNHRFVRDLSGEKISQLGVTASWPITEGWRWVGRWYKDIERNRTIESYTGIQYESCCWSVSIVAERYLSNRFDTTGLRSANEFESGVSLRFSFNGIGNSATNRRKLLQDGLFGYRQPYLLN